MLRIYASIKDVPKSCDVVADVEKQFFLHGISCSDVDQRLVREIEHGELLDANSFIDRFGYKLYTSELSTGCKAALCVQNNQDKIIDLVECGQNARDAIIQFCTGGFAIMHNLDARILCKKDNDEIDVLFDDYHFTSLDRLNFYISDERPFEPDLTIGGVQCIK